MLQTVEVVVDLGSDGGINCFLIEKAVCSTGKVIIWSYCQASSYRTARQWSENPLGGCKPTRLGEPSSLDSKPLYRAVSS